MKKKIIKLLFLPLFLLQTNTYAQEKLYVGTDATEFPPFEYIENGEIKGFDIDLIKEIGKILNKEIVLKNIQFDGLIPALQTGKLDVIIAGMTVTAEREKNINFSNPYYTSKQLLIVNKNSTLSTLESLKGHKVGVVLGCTGDVIATEMGNSITLYRYNTTSESIMALNANKIDAVILDSEPAKNFVKNNSNLKYIDNELAKEDYAIAVGKQNLTLVKNINTALETLKSNGTFKKLNKKYFIEN
ncbi:basic amino acid ABC transporter substrate-binding protein [uncultured Cetobacterium sp.]|uniref:basic amino acid ABC transporter substrate-binding protein n=1 Tax=uncultured Cetobacterium sp. TaxID=527638 RepID=UPI0025E06BD3|nr:basic amino acid ABC transporter substrate-binding protein [uncultured Cetobacterium sp.]